MKFAASFLFLLWISSPASAQSITAGTSTCFPRVAGLAHKLSVPPNDPNNAPSILIAACNGKNYDLLHLIDALLAKMDNSASRASSTKAAVK